MSKFTPMFPNMDTTLAGSYKTSHHVPVNLEHSCMVCGKHHPHSGQMTVSMWCSGCSATNVYKSVSGVMHPADSDRPMISVVV